QSPQVDRPNQMLVPSVATPAYCRSALAGIVGSRGESTCSSNGLTSETSSVGNDPVQLGPALSVPVQTPLPLSGMLPDPDGMRLAPIADGPVIVEASRVER